MDVIYKILKYVGEKRLKKENVNKFFYNHDKVNIIIRNKIYDIVLST